MSHDLEKQGYLFRGFNAAHEPTTVMAEIGERFECDVLVTDGHFVTDYERLNGCKALYVMDEGERFSLKGRYLIADDAFYIDEIFHLVLPEEQTT